MRLLTKSEVQKEIAVERKMQIDEGISLARKVDGLRQTAGSEEAELEQFRTGTTTVVLEELHDLITQRDNLKIEVRSLEEQRDTALDPLYKKEAEVDKKLEANEIIEQQLIEREQLVSTSEIAIAQSTEEVSRKHGLVDSMLEDAQDKLTASTDILLAARVKEDGMNAELTRREAKVIGRERAAFVKEQGLNVRERDLNNRMATFKQAQKAMAVREAELTDRETTYQRNVERDDKRSTGRK